MEWLRDMLSVLVQMKRRWIGLIVGCLFWLIWMVFGFWATILFVVLGGLGFFLGRLSEEKQSWKDVVEKLLAERFD